MGLLRYYCRYDLQHVKDKGSVDLELCCFYSASLFYGIYLTNARDAVCSTNKSKRNQITFYIHVKIPLKKVE